MDLFDYFTLNIDLKYAERLDPVLNPAIKTMNTIIKCMHLSGMEVTAKSIMALVAEQENFIKFLKDFFRGEHELDDRLALKQILDRFSSDNYFNYLLFYSYIMGIVSVILPTTQAVINNPTLKNLIFVGGKYNQDGKLESEQNYLTVSKGDTSIFQYDIYTIPVSIMKDIIYNKFNHKTGIIFIDGSQEQEYLETLKKNAKIFDRTNDLVIYNNLDFDIEDVILSKKIAYINVKQTKHSSAKLEQFAERLQKTLSEINDPNDSFDLITHDCEGLFTYKWQDMQDSLKQHKQWVNIYHLCTNLHMMPESMRNNTTYQFLINTTKSRPLQQLSPYQGMTGFHLLETLESYETLIVHDGKATKYAPHL